MKQLKKFYLNLRSFYEKRKNLIQNLYFVFVFCICGFLGVFLYFPKQHTYTEEEKNYAYELAQSVWNPELCSIECNDLLLKVEFNNATVTQSGSLVSVTLKDEYSTSYKNHIAFDFYTSDLYIEDDNWEIYEYIMAIIFVFLGFGGFSIFIALIVLVAITLVFKVINFILEHILKILSRQLK